MTKSGWVLPGIALVVLILAAGGAALTLHPSLPAIAPPPPQNFDRTVVKRGEDLARLGNCAGCHTAEPGAGRWPAACALATPFGTVIRHQHHARRTRPASAPGRARPSGARCGAASRATAASLSRLSLRPLHPCERRRARCALCLADDAAGPSQAARRRPARRPLGFRPLVAGWNLLYLHEGPLRPIRHSRRLESRPRAGRGAGALRRLPHAAQQPRRRGQRARLRRRLDRRLVRAAAQRPLARRARHGRRTSSTPICAPASATTHAAAAGPMGGVTRALARGAGRRRARDRRLLRLADAQAPAAARRTQAEPIDRRAIARAGASRGGDAVRRRLRRLPRARRADDAAGPAAARLGHAAAGRQRRTTRCASSCKGLASPAGAIGPTMPAFADMLNDRQLAALAAYLRARFTDQPPWSDISSDAVAQSARRGEP